MGVCVMARSCMAVDRAYVERLQAWVTGEAGRVATNPQDKGINALSRHTEKVLAPYGVDGFSTTVISRWVNGEVKQELRAESLERIGLLRGFSKDKDEARQMAYTWLSTGRLPDSTPALMPPTIAPPDVADAIAQGQYDLEQTKAIAVAAIERLAAIAQTPTPDVKTEVQPVDSSLKLILKGLISTGRTTLPDMTKAVGVDEARMSDIIEGYPMSPDECLAVSALTKLTPETLVAWGLCPELAERDR